MHLLCCHRSYSPKRLDRKSGYEVQRLVRMYGTQSIRFPIVRCNLCKKFIIGDSGRCDQVQLFPDTKFYLLCNINCQRDSFLILRNIQKGLIQRQRLNYIGILMKDFVYLTGDGLINIHSSGYKNKLGT